jgi:hypothetical protein
MSENVDIDHKRLGIDLFNYVWTLLDKSDRTQEEIDDMIHSAHASRYHWSKVGTQVHFARGEWQISRVYAVVGRSEPAYYHGNRCLQICEANNIADFDLAYAYEALARAAAVAGNKAELTEYLAKANAAGENIAEEDDKKLFYSDIASVPTL